MLLSWSDYFSGSATEYSQRTSRLTSFSGNAYIKNCFFNGLSATGDGGSILYSSSSLNLLMLIESCSFINSKSTQLGGALHFLSSGQYVMAKTCGHGCISTSSNCLFDRVLVTDNINSKNEIHDSAICCSIQPSRAFETQHNYGKIVIKHTNFSSNSCQYYASIYSWPTSNGNYVASSISYTTVANNIVSDGKCIILGSSYSYEIDSCNFISNTDRSSNRGLIHVSGSLNMQGSCIVNNSGTYIIYNGGGKSITVTNCTIDSTSKNYGNVVINSTPATSFINKIEFIETALCYAKYDSVGSLTAFPNITKTNTFGIPPEKLEIFIQMYCGKYTGNELIRAFSYLLLHSFIPFEQ
jgi:hypothetical protein